MGEERDLLDLGLTSDSKKLLLEACEEFVADGSILEETVSKTSFGEFVEADGMESWGF